MPVQQTAAAIFKRVDALLAAVSPNHNVMLLRVIAALVSVLCFAGDQVFGYPALALAGTVTYIICLLLYAEGLFKTIILMHRVSAELLIVAVMVVTFLDGQPPLSGGALVAWVIGLGLFIATSIIRKNRERIEGGLVKEGKQTARVIKDDTVREIGLHEVSVGDLVIVPPKGAMVPVDGVVTEGGHSSVDESAVTGEPYPVFKQAGSQVTSGTLNLSAPIHVSATRNGDDTYLSVVTKEIEESLAQKSETQQHAETIVQVFLIGVTGYAGLLYFITGDLHLPAAVLSVACPPCAWALATPAAFAATIGRLSRMHVLTRGGEPLERLVGAETLVTDKTGTLTRAEPVVGKVVTLNGADEREVLRYAAAVEARFCHPIATAITAHAEVQETGALPEVTESEELPPGQGVRAMIDDSIVFIGSGETLRAAGITLPAVQYEGRAVWLAVEDEPRGVFVIRDALPDTVDGFADAVRACGISRVVLATGDQEEGEAQRVAAAIGGADEYHAGCRPEDKTALVKRFQKEGQVVMVGDGTNDAPALAAADVGIAIGGHRNPGLVVRSAEIVVLGDDPPAAVPDILAAGGKAMKRAITQNYAWAVGFNTIGIALATAGGVLNPILAAVLHHISSVFVVANAARLYYRRGGTFRNKNG
ncbi:cation-translocating P-type ATPase [Methanogenium cariaci]|uniref:heavy metal translocating P-type ATPase n=1 Tax=Methanogenium cariaci TaxID=2197 RepID=UPI0007822ECD|nr:heavy metal translocating P-type ATPase [Methanogenium cariaci]